MGFTVEIPKIKIDPEDIFATADWIRLLELFMLALVTIRTLRIDSGKTTHGAPLLDGGVDRYHPAYEKARALGKVVIDRGKTKTKIGPRANYQPGTRLLLTGDMLRAVGFNDLNNIQRKMIGQNIEVIKSKLAASAFLYFSYEEAKKAYYNNLRREFIEFTQEEYDRAFEQAVEMYRKERGS